MNTANTLNEHVSGGLTLLDRIGKKRLRNILILVAVLLVLSIVAISADGWDLFIQRVFNGLNNGFIYSAMALALVLIYKATGVVNFAQGDMAMFGTFICYVFAVDWGVPVGLAILMGMAASAGGAAVIERVLIRPFDPRNHLAITIVTLGLLLVLSSMAGVIWGYDPRAFPTPFPKRNKSFEFLGAQIQWTSLYTWITILVAVLLVSLLLNKTKIGLAFRSVSSNLESSELVGIHVGRTLQFGWALAAAVGTLAGSLIANTTLLDPNFMGRVLIYSFAAATLGGLDSLGGAVIAGIIIGEVETMAGGYIDFIGSTLAPTVALFVIVIVLLVRPNGLFGSKHVEHVLMAAVKLKQGTTGHRVYQWGAWLLAAFVLIYVMFAYRTGFAPASIDKAFRITQLNDVLAYAVAILGLNLVIGYSGQLSLGHSAFVGLGAYTTIILVADHHWSYFATIPVSAALCFLVGIVVGLPALRIRGLYLAIVTLSVAFVFPTLVLKYDWLTGGPNGKKPPRGEAELIPPSWMPFSDAGRLATPLYTYFLLLVMATILFVLARNFIKSRPGRALIAVRDNQTSAAVSGVNLPIYKALTFGISAAFGGVAGTMLMMNRPFASDVQFSIQLAIFLVVGLVIGGAGTISGAVPGALVYVFVSYFMAGWAEDQSGMPPGLKQITAPLFDWLETRQGGGSIAGVFFGILLLIAVFILPGGIIDGLRRLRARIVTVIPNPGWFRERARTHTGQPKDQTPEDDDNTVSTLTEVSVNEGF